MINIRTSKVMDELHKIREGIYDETKDMRLEEKLDYFHKASLELCAKFGLKRMRAEKVK